MAEDILKSYSIKGIFEKTSDGVVVSGDMETNNDKKITTLNGTAKKDGVFVCTFNIGNRPGPVPGQPDSGENAINYNNVVDDTLLEAVAPVIRAVIAQLRVKVANM